MEGKRDFLAGGGGMVGGVHELEHGAAIFSGDQRGFIFADAFDEMGEFLGIALIEGLFENRKRPAFGGAGFFHGIAIAVFAVGEGGVALDQLGINEYDGSMHL